MNQIGSRILKLKDQVKAEYKDNILTVTGPKGTLSRKFNDIVKIELKDNTISTTSDLSSKFSRSMVGTINSHIFNMLEGVEKGFSKKLLIVGVGYRASIKDNAVVLLLGFSHPVILKIPAGVEVSVVRNTTIVVSGIDKEKVSAFAALIRSKKKPEPYLGKGIKYDDEHIIRKVGKSANK